jgi:glycosyltransferase involved in cell wall biosynthesis
VITLDADLQHDPETIPRMLRLREDADIVLCSRFSNLTGMPTDRFLSNRLSSLWASLVAGRRIEDVQCGFRLIRTGLIRSIRLTTSKYETEPEFLIRAARAGARIVSCPIHTRYGEESSSINRLADTLRFVAMTVKLLLRCC